VLLVTDHSAYDYPAILRHARLLVDTRNATADFPAGRCRVVKA
jgi:UDP-N-acetyl-D-glucosamine dehydrogenase